MRLKYKLCITFYLASLTCVAVAQHNITAALYEAKAQQASSAAFYYQRQADKAQANDNLWQAALQVAARATDGKVLK